MTLHRSRHTPRFGRVSSLALSLFAIATALTITSCGIGTFTRKVFGEKLELDIMVDSIANNEIPLSMDVVYVYDEELFKNLLSMSARQWFDKKQEIANNFPDESGFEAFGWEWIPGQDTAVEIPLRASTVGGIIFVNYYNEGQHRVRIDLFRDVSVKLGFDEFRVVPM